MTVGVAHFRAQDVLHDEQKHGRNWCKHAWVVLASQAMTEKQPTVLTLNQVGERLQVSRPTVQRLIDDGKLAGFKVGRNWRVRTEALERFMEEGEQR